MREKFNTFERPLSDFLQTSFRKYSRVITLKPCRRFPFVKRDNFLIVEETFYQLGHGNLLFQVHFLNDHSSRRENSFEL